MMHRSTPVLLLLLTTLAVVPSCAPRYTSAALGRYEEYQPYARLRGRAIELDLARGGHVAIINVLTPNPAFRDRPVLFEAVYPLYETDQRRFPAGRHALLPRRETVRTPLRCGMEQIPTIAGCHRDFGMLPGVRSASEYRRDFSIRNGHYIVIVSDDPVDPFTIAEELFYMTLDHPELKEQLLTLNAEAAAAGLERLLLDRPGTANWAALYVAAR